MSTDIQDPITLSKIEDPVTAPCGHTYDRSSLVALASRSNWSCGVCRAVWSSSFTPNAPSNFALKALLHETDAGTNSSTSQALAPPPPQLPPPPPIQVTAIRVDGTDYTQISLFVPDAPAAAMPTLFIHGLDRSGSMGSSSVDTTQSSTDAAIFSRTDLLEHALTTQIELARPEDSIAFVAFDDVADVILEPTLMNTPENRQKAKRALIHIKPRGGTNIWAGLLKAYTIAASPEHADKNIVIIFQTDGEPSRDYIPPKGIAATFRNWLDTHPVPNATLHTVGYGFGSSLDMRLLRSLAEIGNGTANYVPDGSMIGTVFIHLSANLMSILYRGVRIQIPEVAITVPVGYLQGGQRRSFLVSGAFTEISVVAESPATTVTVTSTGGPPDIFARVRTDLIDNLKAALSIAETDGAHQAIGPHLLSSIVTTCKEKAGADPRVAALLTDLTDTDPHKGQLGKAFANQSAFTRWGRHYVPGVLCGHQCEWPINFKDEGSTIYGEPGGFTRTLIDRGDTIFNSLPPPTASCSPVVSRYTTTGISSPPSSAPRLTSMMSVHSSAGPCFLGASRVKMAGGTEKRCDQIQPGDRDAAGYVIDKVIKTIVSHADIVRIQNVNLRPDGHASLEESGGFTSRHPIFYNGAWVLPESVGTVERVETNAVYNFLLAHASANPSVLIINGLMTCVMGHDLTAPVVRHPYFGKRETGLRNIRDDLHEAPGWDSGYITLSNVQMIRDPNTGFICGMITGTTNDMHDLPGANACEMDPTETV